jgi:hypothetical protein
LRLSGGDLWPLLEITIFALDATGDASSVFATKPDQILMKKNALLRLFQIRPITILAITFAALVLSRPTFANPIPLHTLDITENSSTSLTVIFDTNNVTASVVALNSPDNWTLTFDPSIQFGVFNSFWLEPDPNFVNVVFNNGPNDSNVLFVLSENPNTGGAVPDGTTQNQGITVNGQLGRVDIRFFDKGDVATAPDTGTTASLFGLSLTGLAFLRRKLS